MSKSADKPEEKLKEKSDKTFLQTLPGVLASLSALITAIGGCIAVIFGIPAISNAVFGATPTPILIQITSSPEIDTPTFTQTPINAPQSTNNLQSTLLVRLPTLQEIESGTPTSIWTANSIQIQDMPKPGIQVYSGNVQKNSEYLFPMYWCAKSLNILDDNLKSISIQFFINDEPISSDYIRNYIGDLDAGWKCKYFSVILGGWNENIQYTLEVRRIISQNISDGTSQYSIGTYTRKIIIDVR